MPRGKPAEVEMDPGQPANLRFLSFGEEPVDDTALIEDFEGARMQPARPRPGHILVRTPFDNHHVHARERQLARHHHPGRPAAGDYHCMLDVWHVVTPWICC